MTKRFFLFFLFISFVMGMNAQVAKWDIHPKYYEIKTIPEYKLILSKSDDSTYVWNMDGQLLFSTAEVLHPFKGGKAVLTKFGSDQILGFYSTNGRFTKLNSCKVACDYPFFSDGYLLTKQNGLYQFVNESGENVFSKNISAYPFSQGKAVCCTYIDWSKKKDPYRYYQNVDGSKAGFNLNGKNVEIDEVKFISTFTVMGEGLVVIKDKVYTYNANVEELKPIYIGEDEKSRKKPASVDGEYAEWLIKAGDNGKMLSARMGKLGSVKIKFTANLCPVVADFYDKEGSHLRKQYFAEEKSVEPQITTLIGKTQSVKTKKWNLTYNEEEVLIHQFDEIKPVNKNTAFVLYKGKWGMLSILEDASYSLKMNKGKDIGFRHKNHETEIRLDLPSYLSSKNISFNVVEDDKCHIDGTSVLRKDTENGNFVTYKCVLDIPKDLSDVLSDVQYNVLVNNEGLIHPQISLNTKAWYIKRFNIDILEQSPIENGLFTFTIGIDEQKSLGESDYPFALDVASDSIQVKKEKLSETRYRIFLSSIKEGVNELSLIIKEDGCPNSVFPFEFVYVKPVRKTRNTAEVKEQAVVRKKVARDTNKKLVIKKNIISI